MSSPLQVIRFLLRNSRRIGISIAGAVVLLAGLAMVVLPGPGLLVIAAGLAILGTEYAWAAAALERTKEAGRKAGRAARSVGRRRR
ncbi:MAG TPA: PGPGW domain-containing protein [Acidimicrobiales bacterium]|nr:PGPGW domain-containing protein [Acidimicrobiales bacterium]